jgi:hypothetical protein
MKRHARVILPIVLAALGGWLNSGCIYIPMFGRTIAGRNAASEVGSNRSHKPIRVLMSNRDDVLHVLGQPFVTARDGSALAYAWKVQNGLVIWSLCFGGYGHNGERTLVLRFDSRGLLVSQQVLKSDESLIQLPVVTVSSAPLPPDLESERVRAHAVAARRSVPTTAPAADR